MHLVIFDIDGTLTHTSDVDAACFVRAVADVAGLTGIGSHWTDYTQVTDAGILGQIFERQLGRLPSADESARVRRHFVSLLDAAFRAAPAAFAEVPGAGLAVRTLQAEGEWVLALASGAWRASALFKLKKAGIDAARLPGAFADDAPGRPDIVRIAATRARQHYGHSFTRTVCVGDAVWDVRTAALLGLPFLGVALDRRAAALREHGASHVLPDFTDLDRVRDALRAARVPDDSR